MVLDACWRVLADTLRNASGENEWLVMLLGGRGLPLGEHGRVGGIDPRLYVEQLHVPWLIRFPDCAGRLARSDRLVSQLDLAADHCGLGWRRCGEQSVANRRTKPTAAGRAVRSPAWRDALVMGDTQERGAIRTSAWSLLYKPSGSEEKNELFVRPDDRWEANNVACLCPEIVDGLVAASEAIASRIEAGEPLPDDRVAEELRTAVG